MPPMKTVFILTLLMAAASLQAQSSGGPSMIRQYQLERDGKDLRLVMKTVNPPMANGR